MIKRVSVYLDVWIYSCAARAFACGWELTYATVQVYRRGRKLFNNFPSSIIYKFRHLLDFTRMRFTRRLDVMGHVTRRMTGRKVKSTIHYRLKACCYLFLWNGVDVDTRNPSGASSRDVSDTIRAQEKVRTNPLKRTTHIQDVYIAMKYK